MRTKEKISRSFKRDFPEAIPMVEALDLRVQLRPGNYINGMPTYWLEDTYQLTGYKTKKDGGLFTKADAELWIKSTLQDIADGRAEVAAESREQRFARIIAGMKTIELKRKYFCSYRHPSGDQGTIFFLGDPVDAWVRFWDEPNIAHARDVPIDQLYAALHASFANGGKTMRPMSGRNA